MVHPLDRAVASELSLQVLQLRTRRAELGPQAFDSTYRRAYRVAQLRPFIADPDMDPGDRPCPNPPTRALGERE